VPDWLPWLRLGFLVTSFASLFCYGIQMLLLSSPDNFGKRPLHVSAFLAYTRFFIIGSTISAYRAESPIPLVPLLDGLARYLLAVPAAMLAALALRAQAAWNVPK
jgi:hypothetical protein